MKISTKSWHYQLVDLVSSAGGMPGSLCSYFWWVVYGIAILLFVTTCVCVGIISLGCMIVWTVYLFIGNVHLGLSILGVIALVVAIGLAIYYSIRFAAHKPPGIIMETYRAFKNKVCPIIEYVDVPDANKESESDMGAD